MGRYLSYATSTLFLLVLGFGLWEGFKNIPPAFLQLWGILLAMVITGSIAAFAVLKLAAMYQNDVSTIKQKAPQKRVAAPRARG